jgi:hypothetical protein
MLSRICYPPFDNIFGVLLFGDLFWGGGNVFWEGGVIFWGNFLEVRHMQVDYAAVYCACCRAFVFAINGGNEKRGKRVLLRVLVVVCNLCLPSRI